MMAWMLYQKPGCKACEKVTEWLTEHQVDYLERNIMTDSLDVELVLKLSRQLPDGLMGFVHPLGYIDGRPADLVMEDWPDRDIATWLNQNPGLFLRPVLTDGEHVVAGPDMKRLEALLPLLKS